MKIFLGFIVALILTACAGKQSPVRMGYASQKDATVQVTTLCAGIGGGSGTGVVVGPERILTAYHVVECIGKAYIGINFHGGKVVLAEVEFTAVEDDLAQLRVKGAAFSAGRVRFGQPPGIGDTVCYSAAVPRWERVCGTVLHRRDKRMGGTVVGLKSVPGNSGSGVYNLIGELVGIHQVRFNAEPNQGGFRSIGLVEWPGR